MKNSTPARLGVPLFVGWIFLVLGVFFTVQKPFSGGDLAFVAGRLAGLTRFDWLALFLFGPALWVLGRRVFPSIFGLRLGLLFVLGGILIVYKPFSAANVLAIGRATLDLLVVVWLALLALGLGRWFLYRLRAAGWPLGETLILGTGLGLGALGLLSFGVGWLHLFQPGVGYGLTLALTLLVSPSLVSLVRQARRWRPPRPPGRLAAIYLLFIAWLSLLTALTPPTDWDGLFYHLTGPKLYLQAGGVGGGIDIPHLSFPSLMEMLFAWAMLLRGDIAAKLLHTLFGFLLAGLVYLAAARFFSRKSAWPAVLILASMPMISTLAGWAYNDLALAFYQLAAVYTIIRLTVDRHSPPLRISPSSNLPWLILSGVFVGLAMGLKYTSFVTPLVIGGLILGRGVESPGREGARGQGRRDAGAQERTSALRPPLYALRLKPFLIFSLTVLLTACPWYLRNWLFTGNPVYPFLYDVFGGLFWDQFRAAWYAAAGTGIAAHPVDFISALTDLGQTWFPGALEITLSSSGHYYFNLLATLLTLPVLLTLGIQDVNYWDGRTGPLLLLFLPLILFYGLYLQRRSVSERPAAFNLLSIYALAHFIVWILGITWSRPLWQARLLLPGLAALAPVAGWLWADLLPRFDRPSFSISRFLTLAVGLTLALTMIDGGLLTLKIKPVPYVIGLETREAYLTRRLGAHYYAIQQINARLPPDSKIVFLWEPRSYYCRRVCQPDSILDRFPHLAWQYGSAEAIAQRWRAEGVTHLLVHRAGLDFMLNESPEVIDRQLLAALEKRYGPELFAVGETYEVYKLESRP